MKRYGFVYLTTNLITGKIYIGQKKYARCNSILDPTPSYLGSGRKLKNSIRKHGKNNFKREILCWCYNQKGMDDCEIFFIKYYDSMNERVGYNISSGGQSEIPKEILCKYGVDNPNYGNAWSDEKREKMRLMALLRNYSGENNPNYGKRWCREKRLLRSQSVKDSGKSKGANNGRAVRVVCLENKKEYGTQSEVAALEGVTLNVICSRIKNKKKINGRTYVKKQQ